MGICCAKNGDQARGGKLETKADRSRAGTIAPNIKNFKNLKMINNIEELYKYEKKLGEGSFGTVYSAKRISTQSMHAVKSIKKSSLLSNPMLPGLMMSELTILHDLSHPGIMQVNELLED